MPAAGGAWESQPRSEARHTVERPSTNWDAYQFVQIWDFYANQKWGFFSLYWVTLPQLYKSGRCTLIQRDTEHLYTWFVAHIQYLCYQLCKHSFCHSPLPAPEVIGLHMMTQVRGEVNQAQTMFDMSTFHQLLFLSFAFRTIFTVFQFLLQQLPCLSSTFYDMSQCRIFWTSCTVYKAHTFVLKTIRIS